MQVCKLTRIVCHTRNRGSVNLIRTWKIVESSTSVIRLLPSIRHLATQNDNNTRFEKVHRFLECSNIKSSRVQLCKIVYFFYFMIEQENIFTVPNVLSLGRIVLSPALGYFVLSNNYKLALTFFVLAGVSDMVGVKIKNYTYMYQCPEIIKCKLCLYLV